MNKYGSMAAMAEKNSEALAAAVGRIAETLTSRDGHPSQDVPSPGLSPSAHTLLKDADLSGHSSSGTCRSGCLWFCPSGEEETEGGGGGTY